MLALGIEFRNLPHGRDQLITGLTVLHPSCFVLSKVDSNPAYDNLNERGQDAEDQYFDEDDSSNSEMQVDSVAISKENSSSDDELEEFMNSLKPEILMQDINSKIKHL